VRALIASAAKLPGVTEGIACAGTALESRTLKIEGKAFAFFGPSDLRVKLSRSLPAAQKLARTRPGSCVPGVGGWTKCTLGPGMLPVTTLARWINESYRMFAPPPYGDAKPRTPRPKKPASTKRKQRG